MSNATPKRKKGAFFLTTIQRALLWPLIAGVLVGLVAHVWGSISDRIFGGKFGTPDFKSFAIAGAAFALLIVLVLFFNGLRGLRGESDTNTNELGSISFEYDTFRKSPSSGDSFRVSDAPKQSRRTSVSSKWRVLDTPVQEGKVNELPSA